MKTLKLKNGLKFIRPFKTPNFDSEFIISLIVDGKIP